jgi:hypothetical protein
LTACVTALGDQQVEAIFLSQVQTPAISANPTKMADAPLLANKKAFREFGRLMIIVSQSWDGAPEASWW